MLFKHRPGQSPALALRRFEMGAKFFSPKLIVKKLLAAVLPKPFQLAAGSQWRTSYQNHIKFRAAVLSVKVESLI